MNAIPSVNLEDFISNDSQKKQKFINEIGKAYEEIGFVALRGHFLDEKLVKDLYNEIKKFFELPVEVKQKYEIQGIATSLENETEAVDLATTRVRVFARAAGCDPRDGAGYWCRAVRDCGEVFGERWRRASAHPRNVRRSESGGCASFEFIEPLRSLRGE